MSRSPQPNSLTRPMTLVLCLSLLAAQMSGCANYERLAGLGEAPPLSKIKNPLAVAGYQPITMPMPAAIAPDRQANSLWRAGSRTFFKDLRANRVGDIVTVVIAINDGGKLSNSSSSGRSSKETSFLGNLFGLQKALPKDITDSLPGLADTGSTSAQSGAGTINRTEQINVRLAAIITQVMPNGNLVLEGKQEMLVNFEARDLKIAGIIRPEDISQQNTVSYDSIAEARISYGGRGQLTNVQQPRYGNQILDIILPF
ncbi:MAG: flagellar basal body L-ring protein FlgH [Candidatus Pacebacteria bacterium]|nr:flagellar basal body L-ring protein FlgH [Candidatus Paceibacterota bacterium]